MSRQDYENGVRKANKAISNLSRLMGTKLSVKISKEKIGKYFSKMLQARHLDKPVRADFAKGMWLAYSYYVATGRRLDERLDL